MPEIKVAAASSFADPDGRVFAIGETEIGVFHVAGEFHAWINHCPHLGGPACQGLIIPLTREAVQEDLTSTGREYSKSTFNVACPWHGFEFDIRTGRHPTSPKYRLRRVDVRVEDGDVYVTMPREA